MAIELTSHELDQFHQSLERALACEEFLDRFYDGFLNKNEDIRQFFQHSDMAKLKRKLSTTLRLIILAADDSPGADMYLEYLGKYHRDINVTEDLYGKWLDALIDSVRHCDPQYDSGLEQLWRSAISIGITHMHKAYVHQASS
jgi:hypothetical protein